MAVKKLSISLSEDVAEAAARAAQRDGVSMSTWLNRAAERAIVTADGRAGLRRHFAEHGEPSDDAREWARDIIAKIQAGELT